MIAEFTDRIQEACAKKTPLCLQGGGTKRFYGQPPTGTVLSTRNHQGIIDYDPSELVITARSGTLLSEINALLDEQHQMLAFEPPAFGNDATVGGVVATGLSGPRRPYVGSVRDFILGTVIMNGQAERLVFGGQVMKNVAGYDVSRLMTGSMGCLGLLLEVSIKVLPKPRSEITLSFEMSQAEALAAINGWSGQPLPISASSWENQRLVLRLSGSEAATRDARIRLGGEPMNADLALLHWTELREQTHPFFKVDQKYWRLSLPSTTAVVDLGGSQLIEWGGAQRWLSNPACSTDQLRGTVAALGGHATLFKGGDGTDAIFHPLPDALMTVHKRLKSAFDPAGIFNPGRLYPEL